MKKFFSIVLAILFVFSAMLLGGLGITANAAEYTEAWYAYTVSNGEATITDVDTSISGDISIPSTLGGYTVTCIGYQAFMNCSNLTEVIIPEGVTLIDGAAFLGCSSLADITIPSTIVEIGGSAFAYCEALTSVSIPNGVQQIGYTAFRDCAKLENITIPESVTYIDETCFAYCAALTRIDVSADNQNYTSIDGVLFNKNVTTLIWYSTGSKNASYSVPASVETISARAFSNSSNLESIILTNHIKAIEDWAFFAVDLKEVWYQGSEAEKEFIQIGSSNEPLLSANWNYNSCASAITMLNAAKADLQAAIDKKADIASLNTKVDELMIAIAAAEATAKLYTDEKAIELTNAIITAKTEAVAVAKDLVDTAKTDLQTVIDKKADTVTVNTAIKNLQNAITALENAKDNYIAADAALKTELEAAIAKAKQEALDAAKGYIPYIGTNGNWWIGDTDTGVDANGIKGETGDGIAKIEKTSTQGNVDTYTITLSNGKTFTFTVTNGINGADGKDGVDGKDGLTPFIGENDNWWIGDTDTGMKASTDASVPVGSGNITEAEGVNTVTVVAIGVASLALLSNIVLVAWLVLKNKKSLV